LSVRQERPFRRVISTHDRATARPGGR
jgi:hypothetical protein